MEKQFASYEIASKLKELGFDEKCLAKYIDKKLYITLAGKPYTSGLEKVIAPLWQQVISWLSEQYGLHIVLTINPYSVFNDKFYGFKIYRNSDLQCIENHEQTCLKEVVAIKKAILMAIKIIQNKK